MMCHKDSNNEYIKIKGYAVVRTREGQGDRRSWVGEYWAWSCTVSR